MGLSRNLMSHDLGSGEVGSPPFANRLLGLGQRWAIRDLHRRFRPNLVTTTMPVFQRRLSHRGIMAEVVPLFGNIPPALRDDERISTILRAAGSRMAQRPRGEFLHGVFFGTIHPDFDAN